MTEENHNPTPAVEDAARQEKLSELEILRQSLDAAVAREKETADRLLRLRADMDNYRKRAEQRVGDARAYGQEEILSGVISLMDVLTQAVAASNSSAELDSFRKGLAMVHQQFEKFLTEHGLVKIKSVGEKLDPHRHEALYREPKDGVEEGVILGEIQTGYMKGDRVVRAAKVRVAAAPPETPKDPSAQTEEEKNNV